MSDITVILNGYRRPHVLREQYDAAVTRQSVPPAEVMLWQNHHEGVMFEEDIVARCTAFRGNQNLGVWARFAYALMAKTPYVCVFDDDTIPGSRWLESCLAESQKRRGLYGTIGIVFDSDRGYEGPYHRIGWAAPNETTEKVDMVGHAWFFEREMLTAFWRDLPDPNVTRAGEDIHFSWMLQKHMGLGTYVPPHPATDRSLWGSMPEQAYRYGVDGVAISVTCEGTAPMADAVRKARQAGFRFQRDGEH